MFERVLVCLDGSDLAEEALPYAAEIARRFGSTLVLLEVTAGPSAVVEPTTGYYHATSPGRVQRSEDEAADYLEGIAAGLEKEGLRVEYLTLPGAPGKAIVGYAEENDVGLIVLGTHGRSGLSRLAFGSVADYVLKQSRRPVLMKRPGEQR
jgi:nucleotide-binding universal stress UspA family protein